MTTPNVPARFFPLPDGTKSDIQVKAVSDAVGGVTFVPLEISTPEQAAQWAQIQDALPLSMTQSDAQRMARMAKPIGGAASETDTVTGANIVKELRNQAAVQAATEAEEIQPRTPAEWRQRADAAAKVAASLGLQLVYIPVEDALGNPPHLEVRVPGVPHGMQPGDLVSTEKYLAALARERALTEQKLKLHREYLAQIERERQEAIYNSPENRMSRLEAQNAELARRLAERVSA